MIINFDIPLLYFKTTKCAGTSIEAGVEQAIWGRAPTHGKRASIYPNGFVTGRPHSFVSKKDLIKGVALMSRNFRRYGLSISQCLALATLRPHATVEQVRACLPAELWESAKKVVPVREPIDRGISFFYWSRPEMRQDPSPVSSFEEFTPKIVPAPVDSEVMRFANKSWHLVYFEDLAESIASLLDALGVSNGIQLPTYKSGVRPENSDFRNLLSESAISTLAGNWTLWATKFGYASFARNDSSLPGQRREHQGPRRIDTRDGNHK